VYEPCKKCVKSFDLFNRVHRFENKERKPERKTYDTGSLGKRL